MSAFDRAFNLLKFKVPFTGTKNYKGNRRTHRFNWYDDYDFDGDEPFHGGQDFDVSNWEKPGIMGEAGLASGGQGMTYLEPIISDITGVHPDYTFDEYFKERDRDSPHLTDEEIEAIINRVASTSQHEAVHGAMDGSLMPLLDQYLNQNQTNEPSPLIGHWGEDDAVELYRKWHEYGAITGSTPNPYRQYLQLLSHPHLENSWPELQRRMNEMGEVTRDTGGYDSGETKQAIAEWKGKRAQANAAERLFDTVQDVYE